MIAYKFDYVQDGLRRWLAEPGLNEISNVGSPKDGMSFMLGLLVFGERKLVAVQPDMITVEEIGRNTGNIFRWTFSSDNQQEISLLFKAAYYYLVNHTRSNSELVGKVRDILAATGTQVLDLAQITADYGPDCRGCAFAYAMTLGITDPQLHRTCINIYWSNWNTFVEVLDFHLVLGEPLDVVLRDLRLIAG